MRNAQNEYEKSAEILLSANTTTTTTISTASTTTTATTAAAAAQPLISSSPSSPLGTFIENAENAHSNNNNATAAAAAAHVTKMTDEHKNDNNNDSSNINSFNNNENLITEAAKILLKNGLNGTTAAAAAFLTAATSFQLPTLPTLPAASPLATSSTSPHLARSVNECVGKLLDPPPAHVASCSKVTTMSSAVAVGHVPHVPQRNNGLPSVTSHLKATSKDVSLTATSGVGFLEKSMTASTVDTGVIDYTLGTASNGTQKALCTTSTSASGATGGYTHGGGGRLQFFKDGKFILELARSKDGERGGWVSVPRKHFRQPSATTSTVTPASTANACIYPKIESSTSLSFSDDNSSIQSSPWQRDHCWKQTTPKHNISKEMTVYYRLPKDVTITKAGLRLAKRKRRRPYDDTTNDVRGIKLFERCEDVNTSGHKNKSSSETKNCENTTHRFQNGSTNSSTLKSEDEDRCSTSSLATLVGDNDSTNAEESTEKSGTLTPTPTTAKTIKTEMSSSSVDSTADVAKNAKATECEPEAIAPTPTKEQIKVKIEVDVDNTSLEVEKMNTSEDGDEIMPMTPNELQSQPMMEASTSDENEKKTLSNVDIDDATTPTPTATLTPVQSKTGVEEKRLNKRKIERAKLTSIVQKLIDRMPARVSNLAKVPLPNNSSNAHQHSNFLSNKVSPTSSSSTSPSLTSTSSVSSSATASRLVEYHHHHQQHVSPRKRILREFEKVSLEDTAAACGAGGKRSRAKSNANSAMSSHYRNARSPNNRVHSNACTVPAATAAVESVRSPTLAFNPSSSNGESVQNVSTTSLTSSKVLKNAAATNVPPPRLYSSYSIHSLLGDQGNSSGGGVSTTVVARKNSEQSTSASNVPYHQHNKHQQNTEHSLHVRKSVSPKSPEAGGGKSPSSNAVNKKRSPPYASPIHDSLSRSPSVSNSLDYSPRATPPEFSLTSKQRYGATGLAEQQQNLLTGSSSHQLPHHQHHHRHLQQGGAFYSPYMMSPKYVPGTGTSNITTGATSPPSTSRSPRHSTATFTSPTTTSTTIATAHTQNIPNSYSSHLAPPPLQRDLSPTRSLAVDFPRESTPRTVPKKTASIRRQFASPTASHNTTATVNSSSSSNTSCLSPSERSSEESLSDGKTSSSVTTAAAYQQFLQRSSPNAALTSPLHAAAYYMYPPAAPLPFGSNNAAGGSNVSPGGSSSLTHAVPTSAYIPSYYHSYLSALNFTKHIYMGAGASQSAAARLSSPFHPMSIPYNGVSAAAVAAAAAAAAATATFSGQPHMGHHLMLPPPSAATAAALYGVGGGFGLGLSAAPPPSTSTALPQTHKSTDSNLAIMNADIRGESTMSAVVTTTASARSAHFSSTKDEHSSDVPLNLSKH